MTQTQLAKACNVKTTEIVEVENGTARYNAGLITAIEKAVGAKIDRGRGSKKNNKRRWIKRENSYNGVKVYLLIVALDSGARQS